MDSKKSLILKTALGLENAQTSQHVLVGFDGFIDEIIRLVDTRSSAEEYEPMPQMIDFGNRIVAAAGLSCNIEMVTQQVKLGGNGPIMANSLVSHGYPVHYFGALGGNGMVDQVFQEFAEGCEDVVSLCDPAHTDALEFDDGKIMMGKMDILRQVNWENVLKQISEEALQEKINTLELIGCVNWTMLPYMNSILEGLIPYLAKRETRNKVFIDLTDPRKRSQDDIREVLGILQNMQKVSDVILGLNLGESEQVSSALLGYASDDLTERAAAIHKNLGLTQVVVHPTKSAAVATEEGTWFIDGPFTPKPKLTTGAGDNFNAGYCAGVISGLNPEQCLVSGVCNSGFYVRQARSGNRAEVIKFMRRWAAAEGGPID